MATNPVNFTLYLGERIKDLTIIAVMASLVLNCWKKEVYTYRKKKRKSMMETWKIPMMGGWNILKLSYIKTK